MRKTIIVGAAILAMAVPAIAAGYDALEGHYSREDPRGMSLEATLTRVRPNTYNVSLSTTVPMIGNQPGCGGGVDGQVTIRNGRGVLRAANEQYTPNGRGGSPARYCEVSITIRGYNMQLQELRGCTGYHGAACAFTGRVSHDAAGI